MPPDQQPATAEPTPAEAGSIIAFGTDGSRRRRPRFSATGWAAGLAGDRRLVPLAATLSAVALFASLMSEWQITAVDATVFDDGQVGAKPLPTTIADLGAWGGGYLTGLFVLAAATVLVIFGPAPGRRYARLVGLSTGGVLLGLLAAVAAELGGSSRTLGQAFMIQLGQDQVRLAYGRGLWCALFGVAAAMLALHLAGRHMAPGEASPAAADDGQQAAGAPPPVWSWRRPHNSAAEEGPPDAPFDLTVTSAKPFAPSTEDRDQSD
jgi:hypothetical protein